MSKDSMEGARIGELMIEKVNFFRVRNFERMQPRARGRRDVNCHN